MSNGRRTGSALVLMKIFRQLLRIKKRCSKVAQSLGLLIWGLFSPFRWIFLCYFQQLCRRDSSGLSALESIGLWADPCASTATLTCWQLFAIVNCQRKVVGQQNCQKACFPISPFLSVCRLLISFNTYVYVPLEKLTALCFL